MRPEDTTNVSGMRYCLDCIYVSQHQSCIYVSLAVFQCILASKPFTFSSSSWARLLFTKLLCHAWVLLYTFSTVLNFESVVDPNFTYFLMLMSQLGRYQECTKPGRALQRYGFCIESTRSNGLHLYLRMTVQFICIIRYFKFLIDNILEYYHLQELCGKCLLMQPMHQICLL